MMIYRKPDMAIYESRVIIVYETYASSIVCGKAAQIRIYGDKLA